MKFIQYTTLVAHPPQGWAFFVFWDAVLPTVFDWVAWLFELLWLIGDGPVQCHFNVTAWFCAEYCCYMIGWLDYYITELVYRLGLLSNWLWCVLCTFNFSGLEYLCPLLMFAHKSRWSDDADVTVKSSGQSNTYEFTGRWLFECRSVCLFEAQSSDWASLVCMLELVSDGCSTSTSVEVVWCWVKRAVMSFDTWVMHSSMFAIFSLFGQMKLPASWLVWAPEVHKIGRIFMFQIKITGKRSHLVIYVCTCKEYFEKLKTCHFSNSLINFYYNVPTIPIFMLISQKMSKV